MFSNFLTSYYTFIALVLSHRGLKNEIYYAYIMPFSPSCGLMSDIFSVQHIYHACFVEGFKEQDIAHMTPIIVLLTNLLF